VQMLNLLRHRKILTLKELAAYECPMPVNEEKLSLAVHLAMGPIPGEDGFFRFHVGGKGTKEIKVKASLVYAEPALDDYTLFIQLMKDHIR